MRTTDTIVVNQITWPHEKIYTPSDQPTVYEELSSIAFTNRYLFVIANEMEQVNVKMLNHI